jgi:SAM-dependent methyltransferase
MEDFELLIDLHKDAARQGPGGDAATEQALRLAGIDRTAPLKVADIGCGTGASTLLLARLLNAQITAVDFLQDFLDVLQNRAAQQGLCEKITPLCCSMDALPFEPEQFDVIWSEGAIYHIGFERGVADWKRYLKPGGVLAVSEITWTTAKRPEELQRHWDREYPEIDTAAAKLGVLEQHGYRPCGCFVLPEYCWMKNYYQPMQERFADFLRRNGNTDEARAIIEAEQLEIELYQKYKTDYSYGMYIAQKI